jgi:hypothetical protein
MGEPAFPWPDLLPELQGEIRGRLGPLTTRMLRLTCTREYQVGNPFEVLSTGLEDIFSRAAEEGYLAICKWAYEVGNLSYSVPYGRALVNGHIHVANWVKEQGLGLSDYGICVTDLSNGPLESLQWLFNYACHIPRSFPTTETVDLSVIRWLTHNLGRVPCDEVIVDAFRQLPESAERLLLYLALPAVKERFEISVPGLLKACSLGAWHEVDFVGKYFPLVFEEAARQSPGLTTMIERRSPSHQNLHDLMENVTEFFMEPFDRCAPGPVPRMSGYRRRTRVYCNWRKDA